MFLLMAIGCDARDQVEIYYDSKSLKLIVIHSLQHTFYRSKKVHGQAQFQLDSEVSSAHRKAKAWIEGKKEL